MLYYSAFHYQYSAHNSASHQIFFQSDYLYNCLIIIGVPMTTDSFYKKAYQAAMSSSNVLKTDLTYEDYESIAPLLKNVFHIDVSPTDFFSEPDKDADRAIAEWKYYRKVLDVFGGALIKTEVVEELCKQLYEEYSIIPFVGIIHHYMGDIALSIFRYMREYIDYQTLCEEIDKVYVIKGKKLDRLLLSIIEPYGAEWAHRYIKLLKEISK